MALLAPWRFNEKTSTCAVQTLLRTRSSRTEPGARFLDPTAKRVGLQAPGTTLVRPHAGCVSVRQNIRLFTNTAEVWRTFRSSRSKCIIVLGGFQAPVRTSRETQASFSGDPFRCDPEGSVRPPAARYNSPKFARSRFPARIYLAGFAPTS
jgi:hypothetical protein